VTAFVPLVCSVSNPPSVLLDSSLSFPLSSSSLPPSLPVPRVALEAVRLMTVRVKPCRRVSPSTANTRTGLGTGILPVTGGWGTGQCTANGRRRRRSAGDDATVSLRHGSYVQQIDNMLQHVAHQN
jgi:hypothetical protein